MMFTAGGPKEEQTPKPVRLMLESGSLLIVEGQTLLQVAAQGTEDEG